MKLTFRKAKDGWRWRIKARNGKIIAESGEAYERKSDCEKGWGQVVEYAWSITR